MSDDHKYTMTISRLTVDKLGVKLYDRIVVVIAELIANSYDADATEVSVHAPMDNMLATKSGGQLTDKGFEIVVKDDGSGMTPEQVNSFYLKVGAERRNDPRRGDVSKKYNRKVMGRKGVGKLAPFGVCQKIEVITSGGDKVTGKNAQGQEITGYLTAHLILDRTSILADTDEEYHPVVGNLDGVVREKTGTTIKLTIFDHRRVPKLDDFDRQLAQRFGISTGDWKILLHDTTTSDTNNQREVGEFTVQAMANTKLTLLEPSDKNTVPGHIKKDSGELLSDLQAGFTHEGVFYPVTGWVGYSDKPYKDELMAGVRIYCRGKFAAQTRIFNMKAGFTGEHDVRSYLVGAVNADWLDEEEDLIRTDRQDILWSHELGEAFQDWGQKLVKKIGSLTREPRRKDNWKLFKETSNLEARVKKAFPRESQQDIRDNTLRIARNIVESTRSDELEDTEKVESLIQLSLLFGPHMTLDDKLKEAAQDAQDSLTAVTNILRVARLAELASFGQIADDRVKVIKKVETLKDESSTLEDAFQALLEQAPWLINPQWSPISANQAMSTLKTEFEKFYFAETGEELTLSSFDDAKKRADFVLADQDKLLQIIEIKRPKHKFSDEEMVRMTRYVDLMEAFLDKEGHEDFKRLFPDFHVTLVCDGLNIKGVNKRAFDGLVEKGMLTHITWTAFLLRTRKMHESFLNEAERQRHDAAAE